MGPGFPNDEPRLLAGDFRQGLVVLLLLSDCPAGWGGTAVIPGSHHWVYQDMVAHARAGLPPRSHQTLNAHFVALLRARTEAGRVTLPSCAAAATAAATDGNDPPHYPSFAWSDSQTTLAVEQVVGRAGDIVLMHPLLLHTGTANDGTAGEP